MTKTFDCALTNDWLIIRCLDILKVAINGQLSKLIIHSLKCMRFAFSVYCASAHLHPMKREKGKSFTYIIYIPIDNNNNFTIKMGNTCSTVMPIRSAEGARYCLRSCCHNTERFRQDYRYFLLV